MEHMEKVKTEGFLESKFIIYRHLEFVLSDGRGSDWFDRPIASPTRRWCL